ncbi:MULTISPECIES: hypothetical protein [unclassified Pseudomonas]|uniref:hypothetical protein n=1 Tax=unclassified Pseudomonas TaxID=196821 RepID=UPI00117A447D|nr:MULTISPECIES: hypothetical protein [unclassified Pseudomonas]
MIVIPEALMKEFTLSTVKRIAHGRHGRRVSCFPSRKNHMGVMCDSLLESDFCLELERRKAVKQYISQPFKLTENKSRASYTPDFEVLLHNNQTILYEVKSENRFKYGRSVEKLELFSSILRECGYSLEFALDSDIRHIHRTRNLRMLYHHSFTVTDSEVESFKLNLKKCRQQVASITSLLSSGFEPRLIAYGLFYQVLHADLNHPLTINSVVKVETTDDHLD